MLLAPETLPARVCRRFKGMGSLCRVAPRGPYFFGCCVHVQYACLHNWINSDTMLNCADTDVSVSSEALERLVLLDIILHNRWKELASCARYCQPIPICDVSASGLIAMFAQANFAARFVLVRFTALQDRPFAR